MNELPPDQDPPDDLDERYRRVSDADASRPSAQVRRAVLEHAAQLAAERASDRKIASIDSKRPPSRRARWRPAIFGTLAAAALAGLLVAPRFLVHAPESGPPLDQATAPTTARLQEIAPVRQRPPEPQRFAAQIPSAPPAAAARRAEIPPPPAAESADTARVAGGYAPAAADSNMPREASADSALPAPPYASASAASASAASAAPSARSKALAGASSTEPAAALRQAAETGDLARVQALLAANVDVDARDADGRTALMLATLNGRAAAVDALLARNADPNLPDAQGVTPLEAAQARNQPLIAAALRRAGAR